MSGSRNVLRQSNAPLRRVERVQFGVLSPDEIKGRVNTVANISLLRLESLRRRFFNS